MIGRRSVPDLGAVGDSFSASSVTPGAAHDQLYNMQMLEAAFHRLPQPKDSERARSVTPVLITYFDFYISASLRPLLHADNNSILCLHAEAPCSHA